MNCIDEVEIEVPPPIDEIELGIPGPPGKSLEIKGSVQTEAELPAVAGENELYVVVQNGHGYLWKNGDWESLGRIIGSDASVTQENITSALGGAPILDDDSRLSDPRTPTAHNHDTAYDPLGAAAAAHAAAIAAAATDATTKAGAAQAAAIAAAATDATTKANAAQAAAVAAAALDATGKVDALKDGVAADGDTLAKLRGLIQGIQTLLTSDNLNLDTLQEVVDFVEANQADLEALGASKVNVADIINVLTDTSSAKPLSAAQGKVLKDALDALSTVVAGKQPAGNYVVEGDARLSDSREWTAATVDQAEAEAGTATTRRAWTSQRVWQAATAAVAEWWSGITSVFARSLVASADASTARGTLGLGTMSTQNANTIAVTGGAMNGVEVGGVTPAAGTFTTLRATGQIRSDASFVAASGTPVYLGNTTDASVAELSSPSPATLKLKTAYLDTFTVSALTGNTSHTALNIDTPSASNFCLFKDGVSLKAIVGSQASIYGDSPNNYGTYLYNAAEYFVSIGGPKILRVLPEGVNVIGKLTTSNLKEDGTGNLGVGSGVPKAWAVGKAIDVGMAGAFFGDGINASWSAGIAQNAYAAAYPGTWKYKVSGIGASRYQCNESLHQWFSAPAGTADADTPFTQDMSLVNRKLILGDNLIPTASVNLSIPNGMQVNNSGGGGYAMLSKPGGGVDIYSYTGTPGAEAYTLIGSESAVSKVQWGGHANANPNSSGSEVPYAGAAYDWSANNPGYQGHLWRAKAVQPNGTYVNYADLVFENPVTGESFRISPNEGIKASKSLTLKGSYDINQNHGVRLTNGEPVGSLSELGVALELVSDGSGNYRGVLANTFNGVRYEVLSTVGSNATFSGNVGVGSAPSTWTGFKALQVLGGAVASGTGLFNNTVLSSNAYFDGTNWTYVGTEPATLYRQLHGAHEWYSAPSGTAGDPITFTQAMTLNAAGVLYLAALVANDYANDAAAASGGIPVGGLYHTSGTVKVRLS